MTEKRIDQRLFDLYDQYCHGYIERREFLQRAMAIAVGATSAAALIESLMPNYADAQMISFTDARMRAEYVSYPSPRGSGTMRGYLVRPMGENARPAPGVLVIHENRGLNPHIEDVARRAAVEGFLALAPDGLTAVGGYPGNDDAGRALQRQIDPEQLKQDMTASAQYLQTHSDCTGALGVTGFCWGGGMTNTLAVELGDAVSAAVPFYGGQPASEDVSRIRAAMLIQYAENDPRINAGWPDFEAALKANGVDYQMYMYPDTQHGFHNNSTPRYNEAAATLAWERTIAFFREHLTS
jgi:carboxymethylenebutenolidase